MIELKSMSLENSVYSDTGVILNFNLSVKIVPTNNLTTVEQDSLLGASFYRMMLDMVNDKP